MKDIDEKRLLPLDKVVDTFSKSIEGREIKK